MEDVPEPVDSPSPTIGEHPAGSTFGMARAQAELRNFFSLQREEMNPAFSLLAEHLLPYLHPGEWEEYVKDPLHFVSLRTVFRGLEFGGATVKNCFMMPQAGEMCGVAVYFSNSPCFAMQCGDLIAVVDRDKLRTSSSFGIVRVGSDVYRAENDAYIRRHEKEHGSPFPIDALYTLDNRWDIESCGSVSDPRIHTISMRLPQPLSAASVYLRIFPVPGHEKVTEYTASSLPVWKWR